MLLLGLVPLELDKAVELLRDLANTDPLAARENMR